MKIFIILVFALFQVIIVKSQELVVDGGFQLIDTLIEQGKEKVSLKNWYQIDTQLPFVGRPLANKDRELSSSQIEIAYHYFPTLGENHCFYTLGHLIEPLDTGIVYLVKIKARISPYATVSSNDIGIGFDYEKKAHSATKQLNIPSASMGGKIIDNKEWTEITGRYVAKGGEKYIIVGQFLGKKSRLYKVEKYSINTKDVARVGKSIPWSHISKFPFETSCYIDKVSVVKDSAQFVGNDFTVEKFRGIELFENIRFEYNSSKLDSASHSVLDKLAFGLSKVGKRITIIGHTDSVGGSLFNLKLSRARAISVANYLVSKGLRKEYISVDGKGDTIPISSNDSEEGRILNRRVEIRFSDI
ncbi:MAG: outer membrane protein OmpA-like peptidoglycan-associated protein [Flammeovirgaceae bacterium]|jgi:outer membrane protein OmpA-like peptidoglycan-associated protein